jgi:hypothetical protein
LCWRDWGQKIEIDEKIRQVDLKIKSAQEFFKNRFHIDYSQVHVELKRLQEEIRIIECRERVRAVKRQENIEKLEATELAYHTQKLLNDLRPDRQQIAELLEKMNTPPQSIRDKLLHEQTSHKLNIITDENFKKVIKHLPQHQAKILLKEHIRVQTKEQNNAKLNAKPKQCDEPPKHSVFALP